jgi:hypothetical protein
VGRPGARERALVRRRREPRNRAAIPALLGDARPAGSDAPAAVFDGRISGTTLRSDGVHAIGLRLEGATLRLLGNAAMVPAQSFVRARDACP